MSQEKNYVGTRFQVSVGNDENVALKMKGSLRDIVVVLASACATDEKAELVLRLTLEVLNEEKRILAEKQNQSQE